MLQLRERLARQVPGAWRVVFSPIIPHLSAMNDDELDSLIRQTHPKPEIPASFQREVWARIAVTEQQSWSGQWQQWSRMLFLWIARPLPAVATVTVMLVSGISLGSLTAPDRSDVMRNAYVDSINPLNASHNAMQP